MEITLDGDRTVVFLNGKKVTDYREGDPIKTPMPIRQFDMRLVRAKVDLLAKSWR